MINLLQFFLKTFLINQKHLVFLLIDQYVLLGYITLDKEPPLWLNLLVVPDVDKYLKDDADKVINGVEKFHCIIGHLAPKLYAEGTTVAVPESDSIGDCMGTSAPCCKSVATKNDPVQFKHTAVLIPNSTPEQDRSFHSFQGVEYSLVNANGLFLPYRGPTFCPAVSTWTYQIVFELNEAKKGIKPRFLPSISLWNGNLNSGLGKNELASASF